MKLSDWFITIFTFLVGILAGVYLYIFSFAPIYEEREYFKANPESDSNTEILSEAPEEYRVSVSNVGDESIEEGLTPEEAEAAYDRPVWTLGGFFERGFKEAGFGD